VEDDVDAVRLLLEADEFNDAARVGQAVVGYLEDRARASYVAALAGEVARGLERGGHPVAQRFVGTEADALLKMGLLEEGLAKRQRALALGEQLVRQEPGRADYLRDLSVSYNKMGDLMRALGQGDAARSFFQKALDLAEQLVRQEPGRADYLRDLSVSYERMGDLLANEGKQDEARTFYAKSLANREALIRQDPGRADLQLGIVVPLVRMGDRPSLTRALDIVKRLEAEGRLTAQHAGWRQAIEQALAQA
jgi:tetratricopeptide (TPR) repeat protein